MRRSSLHFQALVLGVVLVAGCSAPRFEPEHLGTSVDFVCPGDPSGVCDLDDDRELRVGSAAVDMTPTGYESWTDVDGDGSYRTAIDSFADCGLDRLCPGDDGYPGPDSGEDDGEFQALWLAGFGNSRPMQGVADPIWARATVLEQGETRIGLVALDLVGWFHDEVLVARDAARQELDLDHVIVASTHVHEAPDTMGQWGPNIARSGVNPDFKQQVHDSIQAALRQASEGAVPAELRAGSFRIGPELWDGSGINNVNVDSRDPNITDELVATTRFVAIDGGATLATWVNFANHPEASGSENVLMSSDFAHSLRATVEDGAAEGPEGALAGLGGVATYFQGACGGMMTPLGASTIDLDGSVHSSSSLPKAYAVGRVIGYHALQAVASDVAVEAPLLSIRTKDLLVPVENSAFHLMLNAGVFDRVGYDYDDTRLIDEYNQPSLRSEVDLLQIGTVSALTLPGELLPELGIGGYDGSHTGPLRPLIDPGNSNPPDLAAAPTGPFLKDLMPGESKLLLGLANDEIGYLIPDYNYILDEGTPFFDEAAGDHYEETNSVGPSATGLILSTAEGLIAWEAPW